MDTVIPPFLKKGDTIAIIATARWITPEQLHPALDIIHSWGFRTKIGSNAHTHDFQLAGSDDERSADLQSALDDGDVSAILIARGGYGTVRVIDKTDFTHFRKNPKWICGYSDITVLHQHLAQLGISSIHSTMPISFPDVTDEALENLRQSLSGELSSVRWRCLQSTDAKIVDCVILGGNLSVLYSLLGSAEMSAPTQDYILFIEDVDEMQYHVDRMMMALKRSGFLKNAKAIVVGGMTQMKDNTMKYGFSLDNPWGCDAEKTVSRFAAELQIPVFFNFPAGHQDDNRAFFLGKRCTLQAGSGEVAIHFPTTLV